jgi:hypothetical protein
MLFRKKNNDFGDPTTNKLLNKGVYNFDKGEYAEDDRRVRFLERNMVVGMWYVFILSVLLWWLPVFGQMIAGYLGGRKAGTSTRGFAVTLIPCFIIILVLALVDVGLLPSLSSIAAFPSSLIGGVSSVSPQAGAYVSGIYNSLLSLMGLNGNGLLIIMVFGLIGGMMADMNKKEVAQATGNSHTFDGFSSFLSGANIGKFADLVAERVLWTLGTMDNGRKKLFQRAHPEPSALGFGNMKSLPPPSFNHGATSGLREWMGPEPEPSFGYNSHFEEEEEHDLLEGLPNWEPKPSKKKTRMKRNPYEEEWGGSHRDLSEDSMFDSWKEHKRDIDSPKTRQKKGSKSNGGPQRRTKKSTPKKRSPARKPAYEDEDIEMEEGTRPRRKTPARKTEKRDAVVYDDNGEELAPKKAPRKRTISGKKKQPALIKRALETQDKIEEEKAAPEPNLLEEKAPKPKREKITQNFDML